MRLFLFLSKLFYVNYPKILRKYDDGVPKGTKIVPTITLVFYFGEETWDGPKSIYDILDIPDEMKGWAKTFIPDYQMHIIDARHMKEKNIERFDGNLKDFLLMIQEIFNREKLRAAVSLLTAAPFCAPPVIN